MSRNSVDPSRFKKIKDREGEIADTDKLIRAIPKELLLPNGEPKHRAFNMTGLSVDQAKKSSAKDTVTRRVRETMNAHAGGELLAETCRKIEDVVVGPIDDEDDTPAHAEVYGKKTGSSQKFLAKNCVMVQESIEWSGDL